MTQDEKVSTMERAHTEAEEYKLIQQKALTVPWKIEECSTRGGKCWCALIVPVEPLTWGESKKEYCIAPAACLDKEIAEHIVKIHNKSL